jgi:signal transduction histidine kinase
MSHSRSSSAAPTDAQVPRTEFVTNISHEIRTPIATVIGISELLLDDSTLLDGHRALVEKSLRSGEILLDLVGMVLVSRRSRPFLDV